MTLSQLDSNSPSLIAQTLLIIGCVLGLSVSISTIYIATFSLFLPLLQAEFQWSRGAISTGFALAILVLTLVSPSIGRLIGQQSTKKVLILAIVVFSPTIFFLSLVPDNWGVFLFVSVLVGLAGAGSNTFVYISILPQWFDKRLGMALGLSMTGIGFGQAIMPIFTQHLIEIVGWRSAYMALSVLPLLIALPSVLFLIKERRRPSKTILDTTGLKILFQLHPAVKTRYFLNLSICFFLVAAVAGGCSVHAVSILLERGFSPAKAAEIIAFGGVSVLFGRVITGFLLDYVGSFLIGCMILISAACGALAYTSYAPTSIVYLAPVLLGIAMGAEGDLMPYITKQKYTEESFAPVYGLLFTAFNIGVMFGPIALGIFFDFWSTYDGILITFASLCVFLGVPVLMWVVRSSPGQK